MKSFAELEILFQAGFSKDTLFSQIFVIKGQFGDSSKNGCSLQNNSNVMQPRAQMSTLWSYYTLVLFLLKLYSSGAL
jgi:hypothetical protein